MKIVLKRRCINEIRKAIITQKNNVLNGDNKHDAFDYVYGLMLFADNLSILGRKDLDILWNEAAEITA